MDYKGNEFFYIILIILLTFIICNYITENYKEGFDIKKVEAAGKFNEVGPNIAKGLKPIYEDEKKQLISAGKTVQKIILPELKTVMEKNLLPKVEKELKKDLKPGLCNNYDKVCKAIIDPVYVSTNNTCNAMVDETQKDVCGMVNKLIQPELNLISRIKYDIDKHWPKGRWIPKTVDNWKKKVDGWFNMLYNGFSNLKILCPQQFKKLQPCAKTKKYENIVLQKCYDSKKKLGCK